MFVHVAVPVPTLNLLTYRVPSEMATPSVGARVVVPVGTRSVTGVVVALDATTSGLNAADVKPVTALLDGNSFIPRDVVELAQWAAEYYGAGAGETITAVLPPKTRGERADSHKTRRMAVITAAGIEGLESGTSRQRDALAIISGSADGVSTAELAAKGYSADTLNRLARQGFISFRQDVVDRDPFESNALSTEVDGDRELTPDQQAALKRLGRLAEAGTFRATLLHGVTGSGKTELYVRLAALQRARGRGTIVLVPEIALTPAIAATFRKAFGDRVAIQHSGLSDGERHDQWQRIRRGDVDVVVGTRSAVFAPIARLGLIVVDEEHDTSYKQEESPRYNGRDLAIVRAQRAGALVVLGSATPSMETYHNAVSGKFEHIVLAKRVMDRALAAVTIVDMREEYAASGPDVILSRALVEGIAQRLERGEQSVVLLNRRGFATAAFCRQCAGTVDCPNCSVSLVIHGEGSARRARCHYCNYSARVPQTCPLCAAPYMEQAGFGTERVEAEVRRYLPNARVGRLDRDSVRRKGALTALLSRFRAGEIDVLVGTQMIAKGHDFPRVTLVGVVSADVGLGLADFRSSERTFQLITQVAGRAGRGERPGEAIVQTIYPDHYSIQLACRQDYPAFFDREMKFRQAMRYPPHVSLINAVVRARTFTSAMEEASALVHQLRSLGQGHADFRVLGPAPAPLGKLRGEYRVQFLLKSTNRKRMREALLAAIAKRPDVARRTTVDVDPLSVL
jgi:primosomal protein N' (replication factor Y)